MSIKQLVAFLVKVENPLNQLMGQHKLTEEISTKYYINKIIIYALLLANLCVYILLFLFLMIGSTVQHYSKLQ